jgi:hypothetical protein
MFQALEVGSPPSAVGSAAGVGLVAFDRAASELTAVDALVDLLPASDPRIAGTTRAIEEKLSQGLHPVVHCSVRAKCLPGSAEQISLSGSGALGTESVAFCFVGTEVLDVVGRRPYGLPR